MISTAARSAVHGAVHIPTRVADTADTEVLQPCAGDFVTVRSIDGEIEYRIRLKAPAGPQCWHGAILAIGRSGVPALVAQGLELDDVVEISQSEMTSLIRCQQVG